MNKKKEGDTAIEHTRVYVPVKREAHFGDGLGVGGLLALRQHVRDIQVKFLTLVIPSIFFSSRHDMSMTAVIARGHGARRPPGLGRVIDTYFLCPREQKLNCVRANTAKEDPPRSLRAI